ncbi:ABC transporter permease [Kitasatospora sp. NPDC058406]|uniref:ABC transporter permease n=1 Tax=Kitasatospora sp. NPDC058406 TaxID=3346483 RepID=UPI00365C68E5
MSAPTTPIGAPVSAPAGAPPRPRTATGPRTASVPRAGTEPRARFRDLFAAEWIRFWSLRSMPWVLGVSALVVIGANLKAAKYTYDHTTPDDPVSAAGASWAATNASFTVFAADIVMIVAGSVGAVVIVSEYATGMIRTTLAAVPDRRAVVTAKASVLAVAMLGYGGLTAGVSFGFGQAILSGRHLGLSITDPGALRVVSAAALLAPVCAFVGLALGVLIRHAAGTVVTTVLLLFLAPASFSESNRWTALVGHAMPLTAWQRLARVDLTETLLPPYPATVGGSWAAYAAWPVLSLLVAVIVLRRRDL